MDLEVKSVKTNNQFKRTQSARLLELTRERARRQALEEFEHTKTCMLARELCFLVRTQRALLEKDDVHNCCSYISKLCKEAHCDEQSEMCGNAAEAVMGNEETYLELCSQSLKKCGESRRSRGKPAEGTTYVA